MCNCEGRHYFDNRAERTPDEHDSQQERDVVVSGEDVQHAHADKLQERRQPRWVRDHGVGASVFEDIFLDPSRGLDAGQRFVGGNHVAE